MIIILIRKKSIIIILLLAAVVTSVHILLLCLLVLLSHVITVFHNHVLSKISSILLLSLVRHLVVLKRCLVEITVEALAMWLFVCGGILVVIDFLDLI